ncbi:ABC-type transport auxiliary lipoprotein family protein [Litchfieldella rifensis]|uniref:ABC-type transport auxiliary lipoprotein family protein n=1 Tax=Litchfieldella rifensis TaxID=762643 RepID=A0ABV7LM47_9GAMM
MRRLAPVLVMGTLLALSLAGCANGLVRQAPTPLHLETPRPPHQPLMLDALGIAEVRLAANLSEHDILYSERDRQWRPYTQAQWRASLSPQLHDLLMDYLSQSGAVEVVHDGSVESNWLLELVVVEWLHDYRAAQPRARIVLRTTLHDGDRVVDQWRWSGERVFAPAGAEAGVAMQQRLLGDYLDDLLQHLSRAVAR